MSLLFLGKRCCGLNGSDSTGIKILPSNIPIEIGRSSGLSDRGIYFGASNPGKPDIWATPQCI